MVDNLIQLYDKRPTNPNSADGCIGYLSDALSCNVIEERNGTFDLSMTYPLDGNNYSMIQPGYYIKCKPNAYDNPQLFKIVDVQKKINGEAQITGHHISYNLINFITGGDSIGEKNSDTTPYTLWNFCTQRALNHLWPNDLYFTFTSDIGASDLWAGWNLNSSYMNLRAVIGGSGEDCMQSIWPDGEFKFDNYNIYFLEHRGQDRGVTIRYGKNMTDISHTVNGSDMYDGVMPIWAKDTSSVRLKRVTGDDDTTNAPIIWRDPSKLDNEKVFLLDLSDRWDDIPSNDQLKNAGKAWLKNSDYSTPKVQITVSFFNLSDAIINDGAGRYGITGDEIEELNKVELCDEVSVYHSAAGIFIKTKVVKTDYNVLNGHYNSIDLGEVSASLATTINGLSGSGSSIINIDSSKAVKNSIYKITEVNWKSDTQFEVKARSSYSSTDAEEAGEGEEITNIFDVSKDGSTLIFTNATSRETITFDDWPDSPSTSGGAAITGNQLCPTYFGTKNFGSRIVTSDNHILEFPQFQSITTDGTYLYIGACDHLDTDGCIIRMKPDGTEMTIGPRIQNIGHTKIMYQNGYIYSSQRKLGTSQSSWNAKGMFKIDPSTLASVGYQNDAFPHVVAFVQNGSKIYYVNDSVDKMYEFTITDFSQGQYTQTLLANLPRPHDYYKELDNSLMQAWSYDGRYIVAIRNSPQFAMIYDTISKTTKLAKIGDVADYRNIGEIETAYTYGGKTVWVAANDVIDPVVDANGNQMGETYITFWYMNMSKGEAGSLSLRENMHPNLNLPHDQTTTRNINVNANAINFYCDGSTTYPFHTLAEAIDRCSRNGDYAGVRFLSDFTGFVRAFDKKIRFTKATDELNVKLRFTDIQSCEFICEGITLHDCEMYHSSLWVVGTSSFSAREFNNYYRSPDILTKEYGGSYKNNVFRCCNLYVKNSSVVDTRKANDILIDVSFTLMNENAGHS